MKPGLYHRNIHNLKEKSHWKDSRIYYPKKDIHIGLNLFVIKTDFAQEADLFKLLYNPRNKELKDSYEMLTHLINKPQSVQMIKVTEGENDNVKIYTPRIGSLWISNKSNAFTLTYHREIAEDVAKTWKENLTNLLDQTNNSFQQIKKYLEIKK